MCLILLFQQLPSTNPTVQASGNESTISSSGTVDGGQPDTNAVPKSESAEEKPEEAVKTEAPALSNSSETKPNKSLCLETSPSSALHWLADLATQKAKEETKGKLLELHICFLTPGFHSGEGNKNKDVFELLGGQQGIIMPV